MRRPLGTLPLLLLAWMIPAPLHAAPPSVEVEVTGVEGAPRENVLAYLSIADKERRKDATEAELRHLYSRGEEEIRRALRPFGYYRPFIRSELRAEGDPWTARFEIEPGPPVEIDSLVVEVVGEGARNPRFQEIERQFPLDRGDVLLHPAYERGKAAFESYAAEGGYLDARFITSRITVDLARYAASIVVRFDTGPRHYFGEVTFDRNVLKPDLLARYPNFQPGEPFDFRKLLDLQSDLSATGYFTRVEVRPVDEADDQVVPVDVSLAPARKVRLTGGVGYGTDDGLRTRGVVEVRRVNRQGHRAQLELLYGQREKKAELQYFIPWPNPRTDVVTFSTGYHDFRINSIDSRIFQTGASASRLLGQWRVTPALFYRRENYEVGVDQGIVTMLIPEGTWSRKRADDQLQTWNGDRVSLNVRGGHDAVVSDVSLIQGKVEGKVIKGFGSKNRGIARLEVGATGTETFRELPASLRFFAGGANSVRGYGYNALGPRDERGEVIGGPYLLVGSLEFGHRFLPRWGGAIFFDMGNALNRFGDTLERGAGIGVRWVSPAGLVRLDFGWGLDRERTPLTVHISLGPEL